MANKIFMPHFSPISWFMAGILFYIILKCFVSVVWWFQNFNFSSSQSFKLPKGSSWGW